MTTKQTYPRPINGCAGTTYGDGTDEYPTVVELSGLCDCPDHVNAIEGGRRYWHKADCQFHATTETPAMTTRHTPGRLYRDEKENHTVVRLDGERNGYVNPIVAEFWDDFATIEEAEANADLYIAAPELAEKLNTMTEGFEAMRAALADCCIDVQADYHRRGVAVLNQYPATIGFDSRALLSRIEKGE